MGKPKCTCVGDIGHVETCPMYSYYTIRELQRKYDALVDGIKSAQSHTSETLRLLQWDQLGWDVPEEVIESLGKADSKLRAIIGAAGEG